MPGPDPDRDLKAVLLARHGRLVMEAYFNGHGRDDLHDVRSVGKSVTGTLLGIARAQGTIADLDQPLLRYLPACAIDADIRARLGGLRLRHLLPLAIVLPQGTGHGSALPRMRGGDKTLDRPFARA